MYRVPEASLNPPSTPNGRRKGGNTQPSTTPRYPPPTSYADVSTAPSTTPAGPPPSSVFGSSRYNSAIPFPSTNAFARNPPADRPLRSLESSDHADEQGYSDGGDAMDEDQDMMSSRAESQVVESVEGSNIPAIAKSLARTATDLHESDDLILDTEHVVESLHAFIRSHQEQDDQIQLALCTASQELLKLWALEQDDRRLDFGIGPGTSASPVTKTLFLATLLLQLHHPPPKTSAQVSLWGSRAGRNTKAIPEVLVDWLRTYHNPYPGDFKDVLEFSPNPTAHNRFWDVVLSSICRGKVREASQLLKEADFREAASALQDGGAKRGYHGTQLGNIQRVVNRAVQVLEACPAVQNNDWDVRNTDWQIYRKRVSQALSDLATFAEGSSVDRSADQNEHFQAENFGMSSVRSDDFLISRQSRKAESKIPWSMYENLQFLYAQLLGTRSEIIAASADWVEATVGMTVWWSGDEDEAAQENLQASRRSFGRSRSTRHMDADPVAAYQQQLVSAFRRASAEPDAELQFNPMSPIEVGLACIFENDLEGLLGILRGWSMTMTASIVEIASLDFWLNEIPKPSSDMMDEFDDEDLMVLSHQRLQPQIMGMTRDDVLVHYTELLCRRDELHSTHLKTEALEGWQLAIQILGRLDSPELANRQIAACLNTLDLRTTEQVEKVVGLCGRLGLTDQARKISERFADFLAKTTHNYGDALYYYARAHQVQKLRDVLDLLVSSCLVQSLAYPPASELDLTLESIISSPKQTIAKLDRLDHEAATTLSTYISGYATLRKFYELRDQEVNLKSGEKPSLRPLARKKEAAAALVAVITSAADSIHGGLYDGSVDSVMQLDILLALLGEALMFVNQPKRLLNATQDFALLKAIEDLTTVSPQIYLQCEDFLKLTLANSRSSSGVLSPHALLKKSTSSLSQFSFIGSSMLGSQQLSSQSSSMGSEVKGAVGEVTRAWDWRKGMKKGATGKDVLTILRLGLAKGISRAWTDGGG